MRRFYLWDDASLRELPDKGFSERDDVVYLLESEVKDEREQLRESLRGLLDVVNEMLGDLGGLGPNELRSVELARTLTEEHDVD